MATMMRRIGAAAVACLAAIATAQAEPVVLAAKSGDMRIKGELVDFDGEFYEIETADGRLMVDAVTVTCTGQDCPPPDALVSRFAIIGDEIAPGLLPALIEAFGLSLGLDIELAEDRLVLDDDARTVAEITLLPPDRDVDAALTSDAPVLVLTDGPVRDPSRSLVLALDGLVAAVAQNNAIDTIGAQQMAQIASGRIVNWKDIGGPDAPITLHTAPMGAGALAAAQLHGLQVPDGVAMTRHPRLIDAADAVATDPYGIAFLPLSATRAARPLALRGDCGMAISADDFTIKTSAWPIRIALSVERPAIRMPLFAREFIGFLGSEPAANVIADFGFAPLGLTARSVDTQGQRLANAILTAGADIPLADVKAMVAMMSGAKRLSATFRFRPGSTDLDAPSRAQADLLASGLILGNYADKIIHLAGFSDSSGGAAANKSLSAERAASVRAAILAAAPDGSLDDVTFEIAGYGEASPLVCEDDDTGAEVNRRVEVWVRDRDPGRD